VQSRRASKKSQALRMTAFGDLQFLAVCAISGPS
jgi:hypothetical protein